MTGPRVPWPAGALLAVTVLFSILLLAVENRWDALRDVDTSAARHLPPFTRSHHLLRWTATAITDLGDPNVWRAAAAVVTVWLLHRHARRAALWVVVTMVGGGLLEAGVKLGVDRPRPSYQRPLVHVVSPSFPSGHAVTVVLGVAVLLTVLLPGAPRRRRIGWAVAGITTCLLVGTTRLLLGVHYLSDVLAGWALAVAWLLVATGMVHPTNLDNKIINNKRPTPQVTT